MQACGVHVPGSAVSFSQLECCRGKYSRKYFDNSFFFFQKACFIRWRGGSKQFDNILKIAIQSSQDWNENICSSHRLGFLCLLAIDFRFQQLWLSWTLALILARASIKSWTKLLTRLSQTLSRFTGSVHCVACVKIHCCRSACIN